MNQLTVAAAAGVTAATLVYLLTPVVRRIALRAGAMVTKPVEDRWGKRVVTRFGGIAIYIGMVTSTLLWVPMHPPMGGLVVGLFLVFLVGLLDDVRRLPPYTKLLLQLVVGCFVVIGGVRIELIPWLWLSVPLSVLWFMLVMNAFNLLDNMDGLAAGIGTIAAVFYALQAIALRQGDVVVLAAVIAGACLGFLRYNFPPAKIFMGDAGSHLLGLSLAALVLMGSWRNSTQLLSILAIPMVILAVPIFDTCFVTLQRLLHHRHPFRGGIDHLSHRLVILGLSQRQTVLVLYGVGIGFGTLSLASLGLKPLAGIVIGLFALTALVLGGAFLAKVNVYEVRREVMDPIEESTQRPATPIDTMLMHKRRLLEVLVDFLLICGAYAGAHLLRFESVLDARTHTLLVQSLPVVILVKLLCFMSFGLYRGVWKYISLVDLITIAKAVTFGSICSATALLYLWRFQGFSRAVFMIDWLLLFVTISASRVAERLFGEWIAFSTEGGARVLIIGAGDTGDLVLRQLLQTNSPRRRVVGFLDDDPRKQGNRLHGLPVLGTCQQLSQTLTLFHVQEVVMAIRQPSPELVLAVEQACDRLGITYRCASALVPEV